MQTQEVLQTIEILDRLENLEELVGNLYAICAVRWKTNGVYWEATASAEYGHAKVIAALKELLRQFPASFHLTPGYSLKHVLHQLARVQEISGQIADGSYSEEDALLVAFDIEDFILEKGLSKLVTSDLEDFHHYQNKIVSETSNHRAMFKVMIAEVDIDHT